MVLTQRVQDLLLPQLLVSEKIAITHSFSIYNYVPHFSVAATPTALTVNRIALTSTKISWTAPSPAPAGCELFYQTTGAGNSTLSGGNTSNTELILTGLTLGETYSFFVVAFGAENIPVLPSAHSNTAMITLCK